MRANDIHSRDDSQSMLAYFGLCILHCVFQFAAEHMPQGGSDKEGSKQEAVVLYVL